LGYRTGSNELPAHSSRQGAETPLTFKTLAVAPSGVVTSLVN
jgi:hypothetical protein